MEPQSIPLADTRDSRMKNQKLRLATVSAIIALVLTIAFLVLKVFQVAVTRIVVQGAPPSFVNVESAIGLSALIAFAPLVMEIVVGHVALAGSARSEVRRRVLATVGIAVGYFYLVCLALDVVLAVLSTTYVSSSDHTTFLQELFYWIG